MKEKILELRAQGKSYNEIKEILGCSKGTIAYHCGEGQKEKTKMNTIKRRNTKIGTVDRKIDRFISSNIRDFKRGTTSRVTNSELSYEEARLKIMSNPYCYLTGRKIDLEDRKSYNLDHIVPSSKGGSNNLDNLGLTCRDANESKFDLSLEEYIALCKEVLEHNGYTVIKN